MDEVERTYGNHGRWYPVSVTVCSVCVSGERIVLGVTHISVFEVLGSVMLHAHLSVKEEEEKKSNVSIDSNDTAERHGARARVPTRAARPKQKREGERDPCASQRTFSLI